MAPAGACPKCLRRSWLLSLVAPYIENALDHTKGELPFNLLRLDNAALVEAVAPKVASALLARIGALHESYFADALRAVDSWAICRHDPFYPASLHELQAAPSALIGLGDPALLVGFDWSEAVTIVGARRATTYGREMARALGAELIALRWKDVDWKASLIRVRRNYTRGRFGTPKTKRSSRAVPMPGRVAAALKEHLKRSEYTGADDLVFCHPETGGPFDASKMRKRFKDAIKAAGVRSIRFHDLRHTFGTRMAAAGAPLRTIQEWMGHRDYKTTEIYADYAPDPVQGARWAEAAFAEEDEEEDGNATDDENKAG